MSSIGTTVDLTPAADKPAEKPMVPNWAYGVIAGGSASLVTAGAVAYHVISKNHRQKTAEAEAKSLNVSVFPSRYSPRPGEKII